MWKWLARVLHVVPAEERQGAALDSGGCWKITAPRDHAAFVRHLHKLLPAGSILYLEGGSPDARISAWLSTHEVPARLKIALGTIWPQPLIFHVPATEDSLAGLADLFERYPAPQVCVHFHGYHENMVLLQWHDAFFDDPLYVSRVVPEERVQAFCKQLGCRYTREQEGV